MSSHLCPVFPPTPVEQIKDVAVGAEESKVFKVDSEAESQLFELDLLFELVFLWIADNFLIDLFQVISTLQNLPWK